MKRRPLKRTLLMVLLLLTYSGGGAIVNVAVAWGITVWGHVENSAAESRDIGVTWGYNLSSHFVIWHRPGCVRVYYVLMPIDELSKSPGRVPPPVPTEIPWWGEREVASYHSNGRYKPPLREAAGWPMLCLWGEYVYIYSPPFAGWTANAPHGGQHRG